MAVSPLALSTVLLIWSLCIGALHANTTVAAFAASASPFAFNWPSSGLLRTFSTEIKQCAEASGFQFRNSDLPTALQLSRMCDQPSCAVIAIQAMQFVNASVTDRLSPPSMYSAFGVSLYNLCWFYRLPDAPCPAGPELDLYARFPDKVAACEQQSSVSFREISGTKFKTSIQAFVKTLSKATPCESTCSDLIVRVRSLYHDLPCPLAVRGDAVETAARTDGVDAFFHGCRDVARDPLDSNYRYQPEWPLPTVSGASDGGQTDFAGSYAEGTRTPVVWRTKIVITQYPMPGSSLQTDSSNQTIENAASTPSSSLPKEAARTNQPPTPSVAGSNVGENELAGAPEPVGDGNVRGGYSIKVIVGISTVTVLVICVIIVIARRKRAQAVKTVESEYVRGPTTPSSMATANEDDHHKPSQIVVTKTLPVDCIQDIQLIGMGGYGAVYLVRDTRNNRLLASKRLVDHQLIKQKIDSFMDEIRLVSTLQHPCVVSFLGATWTNQTDIQALFEYMDGGDLRSYLETNSKHQWTEEKLTIAIDVADALDYVHTQLAIPVVHRDLKSPNVLLTQSPRRAKLSDFGVSREVSSNFSMTTGVGTGRWLAPEVIIGGGTYDSSCDIYALGVVLTELDTHQVPFADSQHPEITILSMVALEGRQPMISEMCPAKIAALARGCMSFKAEERPTAAVVARTLRSILADFTTNLQR